MFVLKRKGNYRLRLARTLKHPGQYRVDVYLFTPYERKLSPWTLAEQQFFFSSMEHRFGLLGLPGKGHVSKTGSSFMLLSPHYEIMHGSWLFQYRTSMDRMRQKVLSEGLTADLLKRALRLVQNFAQRLRETTPEQSKQRRYFKWLDVYFSWHAEQFFLQCMSQPQFADLDAELRQGVYDFLQAEHERRRELKYTEDFRGTASRVWNRMGLYLRLLEYPVVLRSKVTELGGGTRKLVKAASTMFIMSLFTYFLFSARAGGQHLTFSLLLVIAFVYALRDVLRDDIVKGATRWLRKGRPRWKVGLLMPYSNKVLALQKVWLEYRKVSELSPSILPRLGKWAVNEERQVICYRSVLNVGKAALEQDQIQERLSLDCGPLCDMIQATHNKLYRQEDAEDVLSPIEACSVDKQQDYNFLVVCSDPKQNYTRAQRWRLRLGTHGIVLCESRNTHWPSPEQQQKPHWRQRLRGVFKR